MGDFNKETYTKNQFEKAFNAGPGALDPPWTLVEYRVVSSNIRIEVQNPDGDKTSHSFGKDGKDGVSNTGKGAISDKLFNRKFG